MPLHAGLKSEEQNQIFEQSWRRKIIISTNIAESSITIPDIMHVVDSGLVKTKVFDHFNDIEKLMVVPCGKSSAIQRAGRTGRVLDGNCYRIYTENAYKNMADKLPS